MTRTVTRTGWLAAAFAGLAAALPGAARGAPACRAEVAVEPARAVVGEQVLYRVRLHSRGDIVRVEWEQAPAFPHLRTEPLPGDPQPAPSAEGRVREERRALFAERPGVHRLRAPDLVCTRADGALEQAPVPEASLEVSALPAEGRPAGFAGPVGPLTVHLTVTPEELRLGGSLRVAVMVRGVGDLSQLAEPFAPDAFGDAEVFAGRSELALERGRSLLARRHFVYDVVPRAEGVLRVPAVELPYFDPATGRYRTATTGAAAVPVGPREPAAAAAAGAAPRAPEPLPDGDPASRGRWIAGVAALLALAGLSWHVRRRRRGSADRAALRALGQAAESEVRGDLEASAAALERALRAALAPHVGDAAVVTPAELAVRRGLAPAVVAAAHALATLERARFDPEAPPPDPVAVRRAIRDL